MIYRRNPLLMTVMGANPGPRRGTSERQLDKMIGHAWHRLMSGVQVPVMDIPRIFRDIKLEIAAGTALEQAVLSVGARYRVNPSPRFRRNPMAEALVAGATSALVGHALQANPGPSFVVIDASTGQVAFTKRATGVGTEAINRCVQVASRLARRDARSYIVFLDLMGVRRGMEMNVGAVRHMGITCEVFPDGSQTHGNPLNTREVNEIRRRGAALIATGEQKREPWVRGYYQGSGQQAQFLATTYGPLGGRGGQAMLPNPAIKGEWNLLRNRQRLAVLEFAGIPYEEAARLAHRPWSALPDYVRIEVAKGWRDTSREGRGTTRIRRAVPALNPGPAGRKKRRLTLTVEQFADWVKKRRDPRMWKAFLAKFKGYEKWTHGARARKVHLEWVDTPGVDGLWITYDGGKQPESTYIMPKGSPRKGAWKHPWDTMPDIKHDPEAGIVITKLRGQSRITDFYHK